MGILTRLIGKLSKGPGIQNLERFDMVLNMKDGGLLLVIVSSKHLDGSEATLEMLRTKINNYLKMISTPQFRQDFPEPKYILVELNCVDRPDNSVIQELERYTRIHSEMGIQFGWKQ